MNPISRARIRARRELARQGYASLYDRMLSILIVHNPGRLDLARGDARDDYGLPVGTIIPKLPTADRSTLRAMVCREMEHWYRQDAGAAERYESIADEMWQAWAEFQRSSK